MLTKFLFSIALIASPFLANAHNNFFLPGDAFFSVGLSHEVMTRWKNNREAEFYFEYGRYDGGFMACGNMGYTKLELTKLSPAFKKSLSKAFESFDKQQISRSNKRREEGDKLLKINEVVALIYNSDFSGPVGLKLNENWIEEGGGRYGGYASNREAIVMDWLNGPRYRPLDLVNKVDSSSHFMPNAEVHQPSSKLLKIDSSKIKIILVGYADYGSTYFATCPQIDSILDPKSNTASFTEVTEKGFTTHTKSNSNKGFFKKFTAVN